MAEDGAPGAAIAAAPPPGLAWWFSGRRIAAACLAISATAARKDASDLVIIPLGPQKLRPASSPVVIMRSADMGFGTAPGPLYVLVLVAVTNPKNEAMLESIRFSFSDLDCWLCNEIIKSRLG